MRYLSLLLLALPLQAAGLGILTANGTVKVNGFRIWDNATVLDNATVETDKVCARITLNNGAEILLAPSTRIRFTNGTVSLETGSSLTGLPRLCEALIEKRPLSQRP